jgi:3-dehydroquinate synthase
VKHSSGNLFLVGMMGAGKSTIGRQLATQLNKRFVDADRELEARTGVKIAVIFDIEGEAGFRRREAELLEELTAQTDIVLATGGGAVIDAATREYLKTRGTTIYLCASVPDLMARLRHDRRRPLLRGRDPKATLEGLLVEREALYREVAHLVVETGRPNVVRLAQSILESLPHAQTSVARPEAAGATPDLASP